MSQVKALDGRSIDLPLGSGPVQPGSKLILRGEGMPVSKQPGHKGDLVVIVKVVLPSLTKQQKDKLKDVL